MKKTPYTHVFNKFYYHVSDCRCELCLYYMGKARGCKLKKCCCEDIKLEAAANGRIERKKDTMQWDL